MVRLIICLILSNLSTEVRAQVAQADSLILVKLYNSTNGPTWKTKTNWLTGPVSTWHGIYVENKQVLTIQFFDNGLKGTLPDEITNLSKLITLQFFNEPGLIGSLPQNIGNLKELKWFNIRGSKMTGDIPKSITKLTNLINLELHGLFTGTIPDSIGLLEQLESLSLRPNQLSGQLSGTIPQSLYNLKKIKYLSLGGNKLSGTISPALNSMSTIENIFLDKNQFTGDFPSIRNLTKLRDLLIDRNNFTGNLDTILGLHPEMEYCWAFQNNFSGTFSPLHFNSNKTIQILIDNNEISRIGDFSAFNSNVQFSMNCKENRFGFDDLVNNQKLGKKLTVFPQKPLTKDTTIILKLGESFTIKSPMNNQGIVYDWYKNGLKIIGNTNARLIITSFSSGDIGDFHFVARHPSFTSQDSIISGRYKLTDRSTSNKELNKDLYKIRYRPSDQSVLVSLPYLNENTYLRIFALDGRVLAEKLVNSIDTPMSIGNLNTGIYIFNLSNRQGFLSQKFVKY